MDPSQKLTTGKTQFPILRALLQPFPFDQMGFNDSLEPAHHHPMISQSQVLLPSCSQGAKQWTNSTKFPTRLQQGKTVPGLVSIHLLAISHPRRHQLNEATHRPLGPQHKHPHLIFPQLDGATRIHPVFQRKRLHPTSLQLDEATRSHPGYQRKERRNTSP